MNGKVMKYAIREKKFSFELDLIVNRLRCKNCNRTMFFEKINQSLRLTARVKVVENVVVITPWKAEM